MAYLSYELFEKRFLKLKRFFDTPKQSAPRAAGSRQALPVVERQDPTQTITQPLAAASKAA